MSSRFSGFFKRLLYTGLLTTCFSTILPEPSFSVEKKGALWATVGGVDDLVSYGAGAKYSAAGIEVGTGEEGGTGIDALGFIPLSLIEPYLGLGFYTGDDTVAYSGGIHINTKSLMLGAGYHSIRGFNGQIGIRF